MHELTIKNLHASVDGKEIIKGLDLTIKSGEIHALMGPNGSGKSTLSFVLMGHPKYKIDSGDILLNGQSIKDLSPDKRAKLGLFLGFQYPTEISGLNFLTFMKNAYSSTKEKISVMEMKEILKEKIAEAKLAEEFLSRNINEGFSGGEKKRAEILQMGILKPRFSILDETDSGLDVDGLKNVSQTINNSFNENMGILLITHYQRILNYIKPNFVHVMFDGKIVKSGDENLAKEIEEKGYEKIISELEK